MISKKYEIIYVERERNIFDDKEERIFSNLNRRGRIMKNKKIKKSFLQQKKDLRIQNE